MSKKSEATRYKELVAQMEALEDEIAGMEQELEGLVIDDDEDGELFDLTDNDYGFIIRADGQIKALFMPTEYFDIPPSVLEILKTLGVGHPNDIMSHTVH